MYEISTDAGIPRIAAVQLYETSSRSHRCTQQADPEHRIQWYPSRLDKL